MGCMKCGRDTQDGRPFCESCREDMAKHPVKPNIVVQLPQRRPPTAAKGSAYSRRRTVTNEEMIRRLRRRCRTFVTLWLVTLVLLAVTGFFAARYFFGETILLPGQNYSTFDTEETAEP